MQSTLSSQYQVVIPRDIRKKLNLQAGARIMFTPLDSKRALITTVDNDLVTSLEGLGKDVWKKLGGATRYIKQERASWDKK